MFRKLLIGLAAVFLLLALFVASGLPGAGGASAAPGDGLIFLVALGAGAIGGVLLLLALRPE
jgi:hypothetical protein